MKPCKFIDEKIVTISNPNAKNKNAKNWKKKLNELKMIWNTLVSIVWT
jgi:hypothetical protein